MSHDDAILNKHWHHLHDDHVREFQYNQWTAISWHSWKDNMGKIIAIHHECPCRIDISHTRGRNLNQGRGLLSLWLLSDPECEISLSYSYRLMMVCLSPTFPSFYCRNIKMSIKRKNSERDGVFPYRKFT